MASRKQIQVGLVGAGTVGSGVIDILKRHSSLIAKRVGAPVLLKKVADRTRRKTSKLGLSKNQFTTDWREIVEDPSIDVVVELIGGTQTAKEILLTALKNGKHVVTANKALLSTTGREIFKTAHAQKLDICFEAAVGGGIPILRALREGFVANEIQSILAIINGTCNYILSEMSEKGDDFSVVLQKAQELGYAESDPTFDIDGIDAAHKLSILLSIAYGLYVPPSRLYTEGIRRITAFDIECARRFGFCIKLLAIAKSNSKGVQARVHPCMIPLDNPLSSVREAFNAILVEGDFVGPSLLYGKGAGKNPTASAVVGDIVEIARNLLNGVSYTVPPLGYSGGSLKEEGLQPIKELECEYYLRFTATDQPGVLSKIAGILGKHSISIASVYQPSRKSGGKVPIVILTHKAREADLQKALAVIDRLSVVKNKTLLIRIEDH
ncbi:MAG: homoserine dehydrogenase [bacterium]